MEVHAPTHTDSSHPAAGGRKKCLPAGKAGTHYFREFLMLFLAVFCGFLAEFQLEHKIEKNREKQFMQSMVEDLKSDTASIANFNQLRDVRHKMSDSLSKAVFENKYIENGSSVYFWGRGISRRAFFFSTDGTMQQLKNSGGLRLISNKSIADKIIAYDVLYRSILQQQELEEVLLNEYRVMAGRIFDAAVFNKMANLKDTIIIERPEGNPQLKVSSPDILNEFANKLNYWAVGSTRLLQLLEQLKKRAVALIELIKKEYHLK